MKNLFILLITTIILSGCATPPSDIDNNAVYTIVPKGDEAQYQRDVDQCKYETSQNRPFQDARSKPLQADCLMARGHRMVKK
jgi:hypothetical protein